MEKEEMITANLNFARYMAGKYEDSGADREELVSTAFVGLVKAAGAYDPSRGSKFTSYCGLVIDNEIRMYLRKMKHHYCEISYETEVCRGCGMRIADTLGYDQPEYEHFDRNIDIRSTMTAVLSARECSVIEKLYFDGRRQDELAAVMGLSQGMISRIHRTALERLRNAME